MAQFTETGSEGNFNSTTAVTIVSAPGSGQRHVVRSVKIANKDTVAATVEVYKDKGGTAYRICKVTLAVDDTLVLGADDIDVLDATNETIKAVLSAAITTSQPTYNASYAVID